jgi:hypothetical protein
MNTKILLWIVMMGILTGLATATDYYFGNSGNDAWQCNATNPCQTITKLNTLTLTTGDQILFNRTNTWFLPHDNNSIRVTSNVTYKDYGVGDKPRLIGSMVANKTSDWYEIQSNIWVYNGSGVLPNTADSQEDVGNIIKISERD